MAEAAVAAVPTEEALRADGGQQEETPFDQALIDSEEALTRVNAVDLE